MAAQPLRNFTHERLVHEHDVRLLRIHDFPLPEEPVCSLEHYSLTEAPPYTALSYAWGDLDNQQLVQFLPHGKIPVTQNLHAFLSTVPQLRETAPRPLELVWIDALCIDQSDVLERNVQVRQMGAIFGQAREVLVWLGPASEDSGTAAVFLSEAVKIFDKFGYAGLRRKRGSFDSPETFADL